ncbi:MAG: hypothetical protein ACREQ4_13465, partial [Candidatus Binataceae bacterium]
MERASSRNLPRPPAAPISADRFRNDAAAADVVGASRTSISLARRYGAAGLILILAAILFFARLGVRALWSSEFRWAEIAR